MPLPLDYIQDPDVQRNFTKLAQLFPLQSQNVAFPVVTAIPTTGTNGQVIHYLADNTNGVVWALKYRSASASAYKWEYVGGAPLFARVLTVETTASTTYAALTTAGPSIALPLPGDYIVEIGAGSWTGTAATNAYMSYDIGGTAAVDADAFRSRQNSAGNTGIAAGSRSERKAALTAVTLTSKYRVDGGTGSWENRWMQVTPVRVSA
jgi:hypothetical protein